MKTVALFLLKRIGWGAATLLTVIVASFFLQRAAPGGPFDEEREASAAVRAARRAEWRLDEPAWKQLFYYLDGMCSFPPDLKRSMKQPEFTVTELIGPRLAVSASLAGVTLVFSLLIAVPLGLFAALRRNTLLDHATMALCLVGVAVPGFVLAPLLKRVFALELGWLPESRWVGPASMVLPVVAMSAVTIAAVSRLVRAGMLDVLSQDWIRTAHAKGLAPRVVIFRHALRGAILPAISYLGPAAAGLLVGSVVIERVFNIPGLGTYFVEAAFNRDYTLVMGTVIVYSALLIAMNIVVDILLVCLDPRLGLDS